MDFDIVIVGAGTAGCVTAAYLARHTSLTVGVVEAGGRYPAWALHAPLAGLRLRSLWSWRHSTVPMPGLAGRSVVFPMGRVVGGTSAVNAMIAAAGHPDDLDFLRDGQASNLSPTSLHDDLRNLGVITQAPRYQSDFTAAFLDACREQGLERTDPLDGSRSETCGAFQLFQDGGRRWSAAHLLRQHGRTARVHVVPRATVRRIILEGPCAIGVETGGRDSTGIIGARVGVVLAAGAIQTPCILQRSGIGPRQLLESAGIRVVAELPGVGHDLQDHIGVPWVVASRAPAPGRPGRWLSAALRFALFRDGVMASNCCEAGCFFGERGTRPVIEVYTHFQTGKQGRAVEFSTVLLHPRSRGEVGIDPERPWGPPRIDPNYLAAPEDLAMLVEGLRRTIRISNSAALRQFGLSPKSGEIDEGWIRRHATTYYHPGGTCRQGDDADAVVTPTLRVRGLERLWVADNSVLPQIPGGHTAMSALLIGAKAGRMIAATQGAGVDRWQLPP